MSSAVRIALALTAAALVPVLLELLARRRRRPARPVDYLPEAWTYRRLGLRIPGLGQEEKGASRSGLGRRLGRLSWRP